MNTRGFSSFDFFILFSGVRRMGCGNTGEEVEQELDTQLGWGWLSDSVREKFVEMRFDFVTETSLHPARSSR